MLNLSDNRLALPASISGRPTLPGLRALVLNDCGVTWGQVRQESAAFFLLGCFVLVKACPTLPGLRALVLNDCGVTWGQVRDCKAFEAVGCWGGVGQLVGVAVCWRSLI